MKRDLRLVKEVLVAVEESVSQIHSTSLKIEGFSESQIFYHIHILINGGFLEGQNTSSKSGQRYSFLNLTWEGHEFLTAINNKSGWDAINKEVKRQGTSLPFSVVKAIAVEALKGAVGL